jgi:hypothetical protein
MQAHGAYTDSMCVCVGAAFGPPPPPPPPISAALRPATVGEFRPVAAWWPCGCVCDRRAVPLSALQLHVCLRVRPAAASEQKNEIDKFASFLRGPNFPGICSKVCPSVSWALGGRS